MIYIFLLLFVFNYKMLILRTPITSLFMSNMNMRNIHNNSIITDIKHAAILNFVPMLRVHDIVVFHYNGGVMTIDYTPINQSHPDVLMRLLIGKSVPAEVRLRKMAAWNLEEWYGLPNIDVSEIDDIDLRNKINTVIDGWNQKDIKWVGMNLYKRNCKHFSNFLIRNF